MANTLNVFVSYSHQDASYLEGASLLGYLKGLEYVRTVKTCVICQHERISRSSAASHLSGFQPHP